MRKGWNRRSTHHWIYSPWYSCHCHSASTGVKRPSCRGWNHFLSAGCYQGEVCPGPEGQSAETDWRLSWCPRKLRVRRKLHRLKIRTRGTYKLPYSGIAYTMTAIDTDVVEVQRMFDVNVFGPMRMVHHFHDMIIRATGTIVNIGSIGGVIPYLYGCTLLFPQNVQALLRCPWKQPRD